MVMFIEIVGGNIEGVFKAENLPTGDPKDPVFLIRGEVLAAACWITCLTKLESLINELRRAWESLSFAPAWGCRFHPATPIQSLSDAAYFSQKHHWTGLLEPTAFFSNLE